MTRGKGGVEKQQEKTKIVCYYSIIIKAMSNLELVTLRYRPKERLRVRMVCLKSQLEQVGGT